MGAESSLLAQFSVEDKYDVGRATSSDSVSDHKRPLDEKEEQVNVEIYSVRHKEDDQCATLFRFEKAKEAGHCVWKNYVEVLRTIRHPYIVKYIGVTETERSIKLLTEDVIPLECVVGKLSNLEIAAGLHNVIEAIAFFHEKGHLAHNNVCPRSIFVSKGDGCWKLGGMEKASHLSKAGPSKDVSDFALFAVSVLDYAHQQGAEVREFTNKLETFYADNKELSTADLKSLLQQPIFKNDALEIADFMKSITVKTDNEKEKFFSDLPERLRKLDSVIVADKLLPKFLCKMILAEPIAERLLLPSLLAFEEEGLSWQDIAPVFPKETFRKYCTPILTDLLFSRDSHVRLVLIKYLPLYVRSFDKDILKDEILPELLLGLKDTSDGIVAATLHGLAYLIPVLGGAVVVGGEREKQFIDRKPDFRISHYGGCKDVDSLHSEHIAHSLGDVFGERIRGNNTSKLTAVERKKEMDERRTEREKQRELQRQRREERQKQKEQRQKEKEQIKAHKLTKNPGGSSSASTYLSREQSSQLKRRQSKEVLKESNSTELVGDVWKDESEPEWEGFDAGSAESSSEVDIPTSNIPTRQYSFKEISRHDSDSGWSRSFEDEPENSKSLQYPDKTSKKSSGSNVLRLGKKGKVSTGRTREPQESDSSSSAVKSSEKPVPSSVKALPSNTSRQAHKKSKKTELGNEFEVNVTVKKKDNEFDFFSDMTPALNKNIAKTVVIENKRVQDVSSRFQAVESLNVEVTSGWDDDNWDDFA